MPTIQVHFLPQLTTPEALAGATVVVIDILRATTTITYALAAGVPRVIPCGEIDEAKRTAEKTADAVGGVRPLLAGERGGLPIDGFDLGNSPREFTSERVMGKTLVFTTTNGTRAMLHCRQGARVLLGSFVSLHAIVTQLRDSENVHLLCAGTEGEITREDVLAAGAITHELMKPDDPLAAGAWSRVTLNDQARIARDAWQAALPPAELFAGGLSTEWLAKTLAESKGGRNLHRIGLSRDIPDCAALDRFPFVAELDLKAWEIRQA
ncbi:MAG TPA: 2-phosphosulfolactate phosphatase [Pirellulales bacterium]|jgi:2-phosphosulfolactate phosphatase